MEPLAERVLHTLETCLEQVVDPVPPPQHIVVAFSGGCDSTVLLHLLHRILKNKENATLRAVHINHQLQTQADEWASHCQHICAEWGVEFTAINVEVDLSRGLGLEAAAREVRYQALAGNMSDKSVLLTAHNQDDQFETVLLQLMRGAGPHGLSAMDLCREFSTGLHIRPLLGVSRSEIEDYARAHELNWIEDPSNQLLHHDRNFLRHEVIPKLKSRWPSAAKAVSRSADHSRQLCAILDASLEEKLLPQLIRADQLNLDKLSAFNEDEAIQLIRYWLMKLTGSSPSTEQLNQIAQQMLHAREDAEPVLFCCGKELRRFQGVLYCLAPLQSFDESQPIPWDGKSDLEIAGVGTLRSLVIDDQGLSIHKIESSQKTEIRFRQGGEQITLAGRGRHKLKKLFQDEKIPPWERNRIPLIYIDEKLAAVVGYWVDEAFLARNREPSIHVKML